VTSSACVIPIHIFNFFFLFFFKKKIVCFETVANKKILTPRSENEWLNGLHLIFNSEIIINFEDHK
jgi:hypothetical protein